MLTFLFTKRPRSVNSSRNTQYQAFIADAFRHYCKDATIEAPSYAKIYYFRSVAHQVDADNLSKPVLDALSKVAYEDDSIIEHRQSGVIDLRESDISTFDLSQLPDAVADDFMEHIGSQDHLIYVELGTLKSHMFKIGES